MAKRRDLISFFKTHRGRETPLDNATFNTLQTNKKIKISSKLYLYIIMSLPLLRSRRKKLFPSYAL
jgi:hypothetical protein